MAMEVKPSPVVRKLRTENGNTWFRLGALAELMGDQEKALFAYENSLRHSMYNVAVLRQAATICRARENYTKAVEYLRRILDLEGNDGEVWGSLGHCYLMMDNLQNAYTAYQQALYHLPNPKDPNLWYGIGILYDRYGSFEHAEEAFTAVLKMDPKFEKSNEIYFRLGIMYKQQLKHEESLNFFRYILNDPPHPLSAPDIWFQIGHVYELANQFDSAREAYERVLAENPNHVKVLQQLGWLYHHNSNFGDQDAAIRFLLRSLDADPADGQTWYLLGRCFMAQQKYRKAYDAYQQAIYRDGRNPTFWCSIGVLYYQINQPRDALDAYSRAIRLNPYLSEVWYDLGTLYESCSQIDDALDAYQRAAQLDPKNTHIRERLDVLRSRQHSDGSQNQHLSSVPQPRHPAPVASSMVMPQHLQPGSNQNGNHAMIAGGGGGGGGGGGIPSLSNMMPPGGPLVNGGGLGTSSSSSSSSKSDEKRSKKKHFKKKHSKKKKRRKRRHEEELAASKSNLSSAHESAVTSASAAAASVAARLSGTSSMVSSWPSSSSGNSAATTGGESSSSSDNDDSSPPPSTTLHAISAAAQSHAASRSSGHPGSVPGLAALSGAAGVLSTVGSAPSTASSSGSTAPSSASSLFTSQPTVAALGSSSVTGSRDPLLAHLSQSDKGPALPPLQMGDSEKSPVGPLAAISSSSSVNASLPSPKDQIGLTELATKRPREASTLRDDSTSSSSSSTSATTTSSSESTSSPSDEPSTKKLCATPTSLPRVQSMAKLVE